MDAITETLLAGVVAKVTEARNRAERTGDVETVDLLNLALVQLVTIERQVTGFVSYRVRQS